jgi:hypothetical protein
MSTFRARWCGVVVAHVEVGGRLLPEILVTLDRNGRPMRKNFRVVLDPRWLVDLTA